MSPKKILEDKTSAPTEIELNCGLLVWAYELKHPTRSKKTSVKFFMI